MKCSGTSLNILAKQQGPEEVDWASLHIQRNVLSDVSFNVAKLEYTAVLHLFAFVGILFVHLCFLVLLSSAVFGTNTLFAYCALFRVLAGAYMPK